MIHEARFKQFEEGDPTLCCDGVKKEIASAAEGIMLIDPSKTMTHDVECVHCGEKKKIMWILVVKSSWNQSGSAKWVPKDFIDINEEPYKETKNDHRKSSHV